MTQPYSKIMVGMYYVVKQVRLPSHSAALLQVTSHESRVYRGSTLDQPVTASETPSLNVKGPDRAQGPPAASTESANKIMMN